MPGGLCSGFSGPTWSLCHGAFHLSLNAEPIFQACMGAATQKPSLWPLDSSYDKCRAPPHGLAQRVRGCVVNYFFRKLKKIANTRSAAPEKTGRQTHAPTVADQADCCFVARRDPDAFRCVMTRVKTLRYAALLMILDQHLFGACAVVEPLI